jgi:Pectate lyase superfamily protein
VGVSGPCDLAFPAPEVEVSSHGAVGDGTTDDTAALQAAFAVVEANGGTVVFESGKTYLISDKIELRDASNFGVRGNGATLAVADGTPTDAHNPLSFRGCSTFVISDLMIDGNREGRTPKETAGGHNIRLLNDRPRFGYSHVQAALALG